MIDAGLPGRTLLFQREGSWRPGTMTSIISLRARDFYVFPVLCCKKARIEAFFFFFFANPPLASLGGM